MILAKGEKMNNDKLRRKLIWKYFWKRKIEEIWEFIKKKFKGIIFFTFCFLYIGGFIMVIIDTDMSLLITKIFLYAIAIFAILLVAWGILYLLHYLTKEFIAWIKQNWEWATKDADKELSQRRKQ